MGYSYEESNIFFGVKYYCKLPYHKSENHHLNNLNAFINERNSHSLQWTSTC